MMDLPKKLLEAEIDRGTILHSTMFKNIDHGKFFVVIGISVDFVAGFFFINSNINIHLENKPEQFSMQYPMRKDDYDFLHYESFLCATDIETIPIGKLTDSIERGETTFIGKMKREHLKEVLEAARNSKLFSKYQKRQFLYL